MGSKEGDGIDLEFLKSRMDNLKNSKFSLAVAGEVKAGKSTLINALLGEEILPSDVLQTTSAIVEIFKSERSYLRVKYADGKEEKIYDDLTTPDIDEAKEKLNEICKIPDEFRHIPTTLIDEYIASQDAPLQLTEELIREWEEKSGFNNLSGKIQFLNEYIASRPKSAIPVQIQFGYPLKWGFEELRIVDTPGVNAIGAVQDLSFNYLEKSNAILFVHPIKPIESESFKKFVEKNISNRSREMLFLILTHAALHTEEEVKKLHDEAIYIYSKYIPKERILVVDSMLQLILNDLENGKTVEEIADASEEKAGLLAMFKWRAKKRGEPLKKTLEYFSGFNKMYETIDEFSTKAPYLQLQEILRVLKDAYAKQEEEYNARINLLNTKKKDPQEFEYEIKRIKDALKTYKNVLEKTKEEVTQDFTGQSKWQEGLEKVYTEYTKKIKASETIEEVRKHVIDECNILNVAINKFSASITNVLKERLTIINENFTKEHKITLPRIDLDAIEAETKKQAFKIEDVYEEKEKDSAGEAIGGGVLGGLIGYLVGGPVGALIGAGLGTGAGAAVGGGTEKVKVGEKKVYDKEKHLQEIKGRIYEKELPKLVNEAQERFKNLVDIYLKSFRDKFNKAIKARQVALEELQEKKEKNEEIISKIHELSKKKEEILEERERVEEILEDLP